MREPFHSYDIRGIYPTDINEELVEKIGEGIVNSFNLKGKNIVIGYDYRLSSESLFKKLSEGIIKSGANVINIGYTATPTLYHVTITKKYDLGIMITASHNPKEYNGLKICTNEGLGISYEKGLYKIEEYINNLNKTQEKIKENEEQKGDIKNLDVEDEYSNYIKNKLNLKKPLKIAIDTGNGVAGPIVEKILKDKIENKEIELTKLFFEPDGNYPNHTANPLIPENLKDLQETIKNKKLDLGFAFDGDGDRCIVIDNNGEIINTDLLLCLIAKEETPEHPNETYYYDLRFSKIVKEYITSLGNKAVVSKVGHVTYKEKMKYEGGLVAAELSGHVMFKENLNMDDGFFLMTKIINYISKANENISELIKPFKKYYQTKEINNKVNDKDAVLKKIKEEFNDGNLSELDGVTIEYQDFWFNIRKSNTEPLLRLRIEADSKERLEEIKEKILKIIKEFQ